MSQKLPVQGFERVENRSQFDKDSIKNYSEDTDEGCFLEVDVQYPKQLHDLHNDLPILPVKMKIEKVEKRLVNLRDEKEYAVNKKLENKH